MKQGRRGKSHSIHTLKYDVYVIYRGRVIDTSVIFHFLAYLYYLPSGHSPFC